MHPHAGLEYFFIWCWTDMDWLCRTILGRHHLMLLVHCWSNLNLSQNTVKSWNRSRGSCSARFYLELLSFSLKNKLNRCNFNLKKVTKFIWSKCNQSDNSFNLQQTLNNKRMRQKKCDWNKMIVLCLIFIYIYANKKQIWLTKTFSSWKTY